MLTRALAVLVVVAAVLALLGAGTGAYLRSGDSASVSLRSGAWTTPTSTPTATPTPGPLLATVDIKPEALQKKSQGSPLTAYIELPGGYDVRKIDVTTVRVWHEADWVPADKKPASVGDYDGDGIADLMVRFDRKAVIEKLIGDLQPPAQVELWVVGVVATPGGLREFAGVDVAKLVDPSQGADDEATPAATPAPAATATPTPATVAPSATPQPSPTATPTAPPATATPSQTPAPEDTPAPTNTPAPTATPVAAVQTPAAPATQAPPEPTAGSGTEQQ